MARCYWLGSQVSETTARVGGGGGKAVVGTFFPEAQRRSVWPRAPAQRGRKRALEVGAGCWAETSGWWHRGSAPGDRRPKGSTRPTSSLTCGGGEWSRGRPGSLWVWGAWSLKIGASCYPEGAAVEEAERRPHPFRQGGGECRNTFMGVFCCLQFLKDRPGPRRIAPSPVISSSPPCRVALSRLGAGFFCPCLTWCLGVVLQGFEQV